MPDYMHYNANWLLIVDNLSDFAHLAFVHTKTLGGSEEYAYVTKPVDDRAPAARLPRRALAHGRASRRRSTARCMPATRRTRSTAATSATCTIPGIFFLESLFAPAGNGAEKGNLAGAQRIPQLPVHDARDAPLDALLLELPAQLRRRRPDDRAVAAPEPDRGLHGGQEHHRRRSRKCSTPIPNFKMQAIVADAPLAHFRRTLGRLIDEEQGQRRAA